MKYTIGALNKSDRKFIDALWASIPQILEEIKKGENGKEQ